MYRCADIKIIANGDLLMTASDETRAEMADMLRDPNWNYWSVFAELLEIYLCNGSYTPFDAGEGNPFVGLSSAPCIAESMCYSDSGELEIDGRFWYYPNYAITDPLAELKNKGRVIFDLARES